METVLVLVIEDDPAVQVILDEALCEGGYEPALAASGEEAVTLLKGRKLPCRVLVTNINLLGRIDGWQVAKQAGPEFPRRLHDRCCRDQWPVHGVPNSLLLTKPFAPAQLAISNLLNAAPLAPKRLSPPDWIDRRSTELPN
ncbi:response regulator [Bradyrhizobium sp. AUGA SZCCT0222]|uniref:response regulator n=1 Tax=Bradyrhizobium sp. AUGA SZCCT0222 TaxID=2807668 RepID=UPI001BA5C315|nr:response regulator [Bradyrhizobium sp. AUGA SZCCT0222]MBR1270263.1 response regulator [Bradyrhizobium sp. AUGA SZCCT0222]